MLNIHLNGEAVLTPDFAAIQRRLIADRLAKCKCIYGMEENKCQTWNTSIENFNSVKKNNIAGRCFFSSSERCPFHIKRKETGLMKKNYGIDSRCLRKMQSTAHYLIKSTETKHKTLFLTLTFPEFKKHLYPHEANKLLSKFMENLRRRHNCAGYIAVRENGSKFGRLHFHLCISMPFVPFSFLNCYWCWIIRDYCKFAFNAVQTDPETKFIKNSVRAMFYVAKYFSKSGSIKSESRVVFISRNLLNTKFVDYYDKTTGKKTFKKISNIKRSFNRYEVPINDFFDKYPSFVVTYQSEYATGLKLATTKDFIQFCDEFLYNIFDLPSKSPELITGNN